MYHKHHTKGIVVGSKIEGDSNRLIEIFTENFGLINARVQGARNIRSKLRGGSQDFSFSEFSLVRGKGGFKVVSVRAEQNFYESFRNSPLKLRIASNILSLIKKLVSEEEAHGSIFGIVANFFDFLITAKEESIALAECLTLVRILHVLGYMRHDPELLIPMSSSEIEIKDLEMIAPQRSKIIGLINESLRAT
ncbi:MAG: DNA repair protein RecO [Candidatus Zambryskibacteria bacterium RIFCSPLOWO2_01_FULL_39_39]|uniref:DNA repair protein RecO n=1 Tax=Candidatus Zambryskibacteria bacterium RIFCSPLOWO2_01_FULL_39_39 TaxID=1802758 RepID=A0A1G2TWN6_9BACT|nr:MAG: repair protein RecO protein [Parcubacteria group bacterium GW2011_GWA1_38_7]OHA86898.1 MAG: DNA repair protein RecO [Candidatus Zambryskibacteria bacterium RIFCSPHIGHO2_01_FULL_39_63]OHA94463.1 MAG: DNA repair protein RecO [Candidatus Zambryskibacteria bacterium RIFCSPHIGHO2_02_FULL_39_19]OHA98994.1 MAG: DNA repair protein RecO [Candidatus Zambryskibacteria bacterium RIFCSPHIGHO2_12_FULL_39_21]OHB01583.1 MAG: DNA repair protein RecO [Candidatus Zambryskibacteria bacterium RIFCSPLOWO2_01